MSVDHLDASFISESGRLLGELCRVFEEAGFERGDVVDFVVVELLGPGYVVGEVGEISEIESQSSDLEGR